MSDKQEPQKLFELAQYLASSAEGLPKEPEDYGPLRLLEALSRLAKLMEQSYNDEFMGEIAQQIDSNKDIVLSDENKFNEFLQEIVIKFAREAKERI